MTDVLRSGSIIDLGMPFKKKSYGKNVWDMQLFNNKIYFGHGNSSNSGPEPNCGPVPIRYLDLNSDTFGVENVSNTSSTHADEEQIDRFRIINCILTIPGHDAKGESWDFGNFYRLESGIWKKYRNIPKGIHVYDMVAFNGRLFSAIGSDDSGKVYSSIDNGLSWQLVGECVFENFSVGNRFFTFVMVDGKLYATGYIYAINELKTIFLEIDINFNVRTIAVDRSVIAPEYNGQMILKLDRPTNFLGKALYIYGEIYNDHQIIPLALIVADNLLATRKVNLPTGFVPRDILIREETAYLLTSKKVQNDSWIIRVYRSNDAVKWIEEFSFNYVTYAHSFEEYQGTFYFGLGSETEYVSPMTGHILKYTIPYV
ncbi:hypothetical protein [Paenibacillus sp. GCM10023250]|uniref:hypothetical protein n=1 Tax=Paenibacillus sp. GCM10023250 TaxID=3252648 RepID=UPI00360A01FB